MTRTFTWLTCILVAAASAGTATRALTHPAASTAITSITRQIDLSNVEQEFLEAETVFHSVDQSDSVELFTRLIETLAWAGSESVSDTLAQRLLTGSLAYRAQAAFNLGLEPDVLEDLGRLLDIEPGFNLDRVLVSPKFADLFDGLRAERVGEIQILVLPSDADVRIDGEVADWQTGPIPVREGTRTVSAEHPGFARFVQQLPVEAGAISPIDVTLDRVSAVVYLRAGPLDATVTLDGSPVEPLQAADASPGTPPSARDVGEVTIEGLSLGEHTLRIERSGFRPQAHVVAVEALADYDLGPLRLEPTAGTLAVHGVPEGAVIEVGGLPSQPEWTRTDAEGGATFQASLAPGDYTVRVALAARVFESLAAIVDGATARLDVSLRPALSYLGIVGNDDIGRRRIETSLQAAMEAQDQWAFLDRSADGLQIAGDAGVDVETLRALGTASPAQSKAAFGALQQAADAVAPGSLYLLGVLDDDIMATEVTMWLWPAAPGAAHGDAVRLPADGDAVEAQLAEALLAPIDLMAPWFGALVFDSAVGGGPVVHTVIGASPAAAAGLREGDVVSEFGDVSVAHATDFRRAVEQIETDVTVPVSVMRGGRAQQLAVTPVAGPMVLDPDRPERPLATSWIQLDAAQSAEGVPSWLIGLNRAAILMAARAYEDAIPVLRTIEAPDGPGVGAGLVQYWLGVALESLGPDYHGRALAAFAEAASQTEGRMTKPDGPLLWPLARARGAALRP